MKVRVSNIQRFSLHDGPGIRTTIFLKGCNLKCPWCANPENIDLGFTKYKNSETNEEGIFGQDYSLEELYKEIMKDKAYYCLDNGGVTFSGGEPLLQIEKLEPLLEQLQKENINICFETALQVPQKLVAIARKYASEFIVDMKILETNKCKEILNGNCELYFKNLDFLKTHHDEVYIFRIPLNIEYTLSNKNLSLIANALKKYPHQKVEIFKVHNLAENKYKSIGLEFYKFSDVSDEQIKEVFNFLKKSTKNISIIEI